MRDMKNRGRTGVAFGLTVALLLTIITAAMAAGPVTRPGSDYNGSIPRDCPVFETHGDDLLVECTSSDARSDNARIRYRFTKAAGYEGWRKAPATVSADIDVLAGPADCARVRWMYQGSGPRTLRIVVPVNKPRCRVLVHSVTAVQP